jgi:hypothetical protein
MIYLHVDVGDLLGLIDAKDKVELAARDAIKDLAAQTHAHIVEQVQSKLHSTREKYLDALSIQQVSDDVWVINLDAKAMWIEEGMGPHSMVDDLLKSPKAKTAKDGSKYMSVPFQHNVKPTVSTSAQKSLTDTIKAEFQRRKIPYGKIETDAAGNAKKGLLHSIDIKTAPTKTANVPGQGRGPVGQPMQGHTGTPFLKGIKVYQKDVTDKAGKTKTVKSIMTFRTVSSKHRDSEKWVHPGLEPRNFFEEAQDWAMKTFEEKLKSQIFISIEKAL